MRIVREAMCCTGTEEFAERSIVNLSGGERQLVFIAKALAQEPRVLLLDEPVSALDIRHQLDVLNLIRAQTERGVAAIAVLHDLNLAARFCDRLVLMSEGRLLAAGRPEAVLTASNLRTAYRVQAHVCRDVATGALYNDTVVLVFSEFGRRIAENGGGTDHGGAGVAFLIGNHVKGGIYGEYPSLRPEDQIEGDVRPNLDFREVYGAILDQFVRVDSHEVIGRTTHPLQLRKAG
jgi:hypothetical protein